MDIYSTIALIFAALILVSALISLRRRNQKQQEEIARVAEEENFRQIELIRVQNPSQQDLQAYNLIEAERQKVWKNLSFQTSLAPKKIWQTSFELIKQIAAIYHPDTENPQFQASIVDLLELNGRIIERLQEYLEEFPLNTIKDFNIQDVLSYKAYYDKVSQFELVKLAKDHKYLYNIGKYAWMGYNALNPWYWGRKVVFTAGKEGTYRYLLSVILTVVGEEALLVYSKRYIRKQAVAVEKNIAFEMINMAVIDHIVSGEEYDVILNFIVNNPKFNDRLKVTLLKALQRKRSVKPAALSGESYQEKDKKRLLTEVERVARADTLGILKKREALKALEESLKLTSGYRTQLELAPQREVHSLDVLHQSRQREEAILRLMVQAGSTAGNLPDSLGEYIIQRASSYPLPFHEQEQEVILQEATTPTSPDTLTNFIRSNADKERALSEVLDALLWYLPFTREEEEFYTQIVAALDLKKISQKLLYKRLENLLPSDKLLEKPPFEVLKSLFRLITQDEQITALQQTATTYQFLTGGEKPRKKDAPFWVCVTTIRVLVLSAAMLDDTIYQHHLEFKNGSDVRIESGRLHDTYILRNHEQEIRVKNTLFHSSNLKDALKNYLK